MKEYMDKLYKKLHEAMEKPVTLGSAEEVGLYAKTICRLEKLHKHHDEPETATFDRESSACCCSAAMSMFPMRKIPSRWKPAFGMT